jgi:hypothetical protein
VNAKYPNAIECSIIDHSDGCGAKLELTIVTDDFDGVLLLKRHREINNLMKEKGLWLKMRGDERLKLGEVAKGMYIDGDGGYG